MTNLIKPSIDLFIAAAVIYALVQDIRNIPSSQPTVPEASANVTNPVEQLPEMNGVLIKATDNLRKPLADLLAKEQYNVKVESYTFEGQEWWSETFLTYGHMVVVYILMGKYKSETNQQTKNKIMFGGAALVMAWMYFAPQLKQSKIAIEV